MMDTLPPLIPVRQHFAQDRLADVEGAMRSALERLNLAAKIRPGMKIAITGGSRGITGIPLLLRTVVRHIRGLGAEPVVVAAMGSHGGGMIPGQLDVLESLGVTPETVEAEVRGGVAVVELGTTESGFPVFFDAFAASCDGVLVINRVKPHTSFHGPLESGLVKMLVVGLGKPAGAEAFHRLGPDRLSQALAQAGRVILSRMPILGGVAVLENSREETADLVPLAPDRFIEGEPALLRRAAAMLPRLPVKALDLLIVDEMGKNISGTGMDTNVIGRVGIRGIPDGEPDIRRILVRDLSDASHGNANGMGLADFITERFKAKIDFAATYLNTLTATFVERARMPMVMRSDRDALAAALRSLGGPDPATLHVIRIRSTLALEELWLSPVLHAELRGRPEIETLGQPVDWLFDEAGNLAD